MKRDKGKTSKFFRKIVFPLLILGFGLCACGSDELNPLFSVFFVSDRLSPTNTGMDGDIFSTDLLSIGKWVNLTDSKGLPGDDEDYVCGIDFTNGRNRLFFVSDRTDIDNVQGDTDIFTVPINGGSIVNLTDGDVGDRDDLCLGIISNSGAVVFESVRVDQGSKDGDQDLYVASLIFDSFGIVTGANIHIRTQEKEGVDPVQDRLVWIGQGGTLYFESRRNGLDDTPVTEEGPFPNDDGDQHIFSVSSSGSPIIRNLTHDGDTPDATPSADESQDVFCGINESESVLAFHSTRNQGANSDDGLQIPGQTVASAQDIFIRNLNSNQELVAGVNSAIVNLTDAGVFMDGITPGDDLDACNFGFGENAITRNSGQDLVLFVSGRTGSGVHRVDGDGTGFSTFSEITNLPAQGDPIDIFYSDVVFMPSAGVLNAVTNLTDGVIGDDVDTRVGLCGSRLIFASTRTDLAPLSSGIEDDLYGVNLFNGTITNLTDGSAGDDNDIFLCCNQKQNRIAFASGRTDVENFNSDVDIFTAPLGDVPGTVTNLSDDSEGDGDDIFSTILTNAKTANESTGLIGGAGGLFGEGQGIKLTTGLDPVPFPPLDSPDIAGEGYGSPVLSFLDFPIGCNDQNYLIWVSNRTQPHNSSSSDIDVFAVPFEQTDQTFTTKANFLNLTDHPNPNLDANDGLTAISNKSYPDAYFK